MSKKLGYVLLPLILNTMGSTRVLMVVGFVGQLPVPFVMGNPREHLRKNSWTALTVKCLSRSTKTKVEILFYIQKAQKIKNDQRNNYNCNKAFN